VTYAFTDRWKATVGGDFYWGKVSTSFGSQKSNRGLFVETRYSF
jgi:hypothetical protein